MFKLNSALRVTILGAVVLMAFGAAYILADEPETRTAFTFHIYVDPIHGDDDLAFNPSPAAPPAEGWYNPRGSAAPYALQSHPLPLSISGVLQHAPFSFKTVTRAMQYINSEFGQLPWTHPENGLTIDYIIIHCLPGLYGPLLDAEGSPEPFDSASGLYYNGESFPIEVPARVSIQGCSALEVIFDSREHAGDPRDPFCTTPSTNIFYITDLQFGVRHWTFIDSVTVKGARTFEDPDPLQQQFNETGAGIYIKSFESFIHCTISNCFITNNTIGIALSNDGDYRFVKMRPFIINNTIAWNQVGIYSGNFRADDIIWYQQFWGYALPAVVNNIMDSGDPYGRFPAQPFPFWGLHPSDLTVVSPGNPTDYNAYEAPLAIQYNVDPPIYNIPGWKWTCPRGTVQGTYWNYNPRVQVFEDYTGAGTGNPRGSLYVNDIFRNCPLPPINNGDQSRHDFRLVPNAAQDQNAPQVLNPLVNMGIGPESSPITMENDPNNIIDIGWAQTVPPTPGFPPGLPLAADEVAVYQAWDWDAEGFGNPRAAARAGYSGGNPSNIDIGADEMGELIMGGFIENTRIFSRVVPQAQNIQNDRIYFFDLISVNPYPRPKFFPTVGLHPHWWGHVQRDPFFNWSIWAVNQYVNSAANPPENYYYTEGYSPGNRYQLKSPAAPPYANPNQVRRPPFMSNLECDFSPHLLIDIHPWWAMYFRSFGVGSDIFGSNPWFNSSDIAILDNPYLYYDLAQLRIVADGTLNPPGSWLLSQPNGYLISSNQNVFGPFPPSASVTYSINQWGFGDSNGGPDVLPDTSWRGHRFNCQLLFAGPPFACSNLQTFLVVEGEDATNPDSNLRAGSYKPPSVEMPPPPTMQDINKKMEELKAELRRLLLQKKP